jgi:hypothetical protein
MEYGETAVLYIVIFSSTRGFRADLVKITIPREKLSNNSSFYSSKAFVTALKFLSAAKNSSIF